MFDSNSAINIITLLDTNRMVSPLTGLPGNVQIHAEMKKRLMNNERFVMLYLDLDNFKAYNDVYGFVQGDEIIKFSSPMCYECQELEKIFEEVCACFLQ